MSELLLDSEKCQPQDLARIETKEISLATSEPDNISENGVSSLITWDSPTDPTNPKNWPLGRRLALAGLLSFIVALAPISSTMLAPAAPTLHHDLKISVPITSSKWQLVFTIYNLGYGLGPFLLAPFSEVYGRLVVLHSCTAAFLIFNTAAGFSKSAIQLGAFRFLGACVGSTTASVGTGVLGDLFAKHEFGKAGAIYGAMPFLGPVIGPLVGGFAVQYGSWRWMCWALTILGSCVFGLALLLLSETHPQTILRRKKVALMKQTGNKNLYVKDDRDEPLWQTTFRPFRLIATQPLVQALACYLAFLTGVCYTIEYNFPSLWLDRYGQSVSESGLHYLSLGVGLMIGALSCSYLNDRLYKSLTKRNGGVGKAEYRVPLMMLGALLSPVGLFWYGWTAEHREHWALPDTGMSIYSYGFVVGIVNFHMYVVDYYGSYAASAVAAVSVAQSVFGFILPLFGPEMYEKLGYGWTSSLMGIVAIVIGWPLPALLWRYSSSLQEKSPYCARDPKD